MAIKKIFYPFNWWIWTLVLLITAEPCISLMRSIVYNQRLAVVYHHCERGYSLRLMIYTFGDEIHAKAWWYTIAFAMDKKFDKSKLVDFWCGRRARREKQLITVFRERSQQSKKKWRKSMIFAHFDYATWLGNLQFPKAPTISLAVIVGALFPHN